MYALDSAVWVVRTCEYARNGSAKGLGFVFRDEDPFVGVDLDDARDPNAGTPTDWAESIIEELDSYTEVSPSGTGYHVLIEGELPPGRNRRGDVELYETARFFTVTGTHVETTPTDIRERTDALTTVYAEHVADEAVKTTEEPDTAIEQVGGPETDETSESGDPSSGKSVLSDEDLVSKARSASNGAKFERLWRGDAHGYDSHSEADMALACLLAFWTGGETGQMDRLFRRSGLMREKWDAVHYADGSTYGETTIDRAVNVTTEHYSPKAQTGQHQQETHDKNGHSSRAKPTESGSGIDVDASTDGSTVFEREKERIETIQLLEQRLRELERENELLRHERNEERAKRQAIETSEPAEVSRLSKIRTRLRRIVLRRPT